MLIFVKCWYLFGPGYNYYNKVRVYTTPVATGRTTASSSSFVYALLNINATSDLAVDGKPDPIWSNGSCFTSALGDASPWWYVDLGYEYFIYNVVVLNQGDCCGEMSSSTL